MPLSRPTAVVAAIVVLTMFGPAAAHAQSAATFGAIDRGMEAYRLDAHIPGMVWGVVKDGKLVHVKGAGVQNIDTRRPVTPDTLFRIASMTKAFTALSILKLRDDGKLSLDAPAETYVPELKSLKYPTEGSANTQDSNATASVSARWSRAKANGSEALASPFTTNSRRIQPCSPR